MKENKYDEPAFFAQYSQMNRSLQGLRGAGEWHQLQTLLPDFRDKHLLDLGCGFGWHCTYAVEQGAASALGIDLSEKMICQARERNSMPHIEYRCMAIEDYDFPGQAYDIVLSSLTLHYLESFDDLCRKIHHTLRPGGTFVFSVEHPVFTAYGNEDWYRNASGDILHWPVDQYFTEGPRLAGFLGSEVVKYHKTLTTYVNGLLRAGFEITGLIEPEPDPSMLDLPGMRDELRRPMMLLVSAVRK